MDERKYQSLFAELSQYETYGVSMKLEGNPASPMQIVTAHMVREECSYMRDYIWDEHGHMKELSFHDIGKQ